MQDPIRLNTTVTPLQVFPRWTKNAPAKTEEALDKQRRYDSKREGRSGSNSDSNGAEQGPVTLHDVLPPELLGIQQDAPGTATALASYLANQSAAPQELLPDRNGAAAAPESSTGAQAPLALAGGRRGASAPATDWPDLIGVLTTGVHKAAVASTYLKHNDEPVYVPVPDSMIANSTIANGGKIAKLKSMSQNLSENVKSASESVKNVYYRFMTMVPYSVGMFINVFA